MYMYDIIDLKTCFVKWELRRHSKGSRHEQKRLICQEVSAMNTIEVYGEFRLRAIGGGRLKEARLFRSCEITSITNEEVSTLTKTLGIRSIYDMRNRWEVTAKPRAIIPGVRTTACEPSNEHRCKDSSKRLVTGIIGKYGSPEERMKRNYRRYASELLLFGRIIRTIADERTASLVHCAHGKDRTGALCAVVMRVAGAHKDEVMADYLATNIVNADLISCEFKQLSHEMTSTEQAILLSFLEARPAYLNVFFDEIDTLYGSFERYAVEGLRLNSHQIDSIREMAGSTRRSHGNFSQGYLDMTKTARCTSPSLSEASFSLWQKTTRKPGHAI
jgi:protein-tyrosine phosphatase